MSVRAEFANQPASVAAARRFVSGVLGRSSAGIRQRVELLVSELATNAVKHAQSEFEVVVDESDRQVHIEVTDRGSGVPRKKFPAPEETTGRGLLIVASLSDDWGIVEHPCGKSVWFRLSGKPL